ncbi:serine protease trypsin-like protein [Phytophthora sojae]|uniref:Serine protease trypsin-like protein n=1 Tax=Phytophthora sojae (strain P6497) TaxID=1094619 RepID=G5AE91_PHYSP|nr:serine protease trypsin-like protein [Phytophthora sojae]EGZ06493.1 serine protease trypsin-like protein [Phytophthora sojae]|eukprot:XP_009538390.1 serine protease trypsin-like protein [Phytophthora sojae]
MKVVSTLISASLLIGSVSAILGGWKIPQGSKTYVTGLRSTVDPKSPDDFSFCGGALISPTHVLTTASCTTTASANFPSKYKPVKLPAPGGADIRSGTNADCSKATKSTVDNSQVCAGGAQGKSPCQGDTGGPFIKENGRGDADDVLVGLVSGGSGCGVNGSPAIYSRVSSAVPWINTAMKTK